MYLGSSLRVLLLQLAGWLALCWPACVGAQTTEAAVAAPAEITGLVVARSSGGFLGISSEGPILRVAFYDQDKRPIPADVVRVVARWNDGRAKRAVLAAESAGVFVSAAVLSPPFKYMGVIVLVRGDEEAATESYPLNFNLLVRPASPPVPGGSS